MVLFIYSGRCCYGSKYIFTALLWFYIYIQGAAAIVLNIYLTANKKLYNLTEANVCVAAMLQDRSSSLLPKTETFFDLVFVLLKNK